VNRWTLSRKAAADLDSIWRHSMDLWGADQTETYVALLRQSIESAAANPRRGRPCDEIKAGYRKLLAGAHVIFYRTTPAGVHIVRILHQRMDFDRRL